MNSGTAVGKAEFVIVRIDWSSLVGPICLGGQATRIHSRKSTTTRPTQRRWSNQNIILIQYSVVGVEASHQYDRYERRTFRDDLALFLHE
jgi:hypothetical protein